MSADGEVVGRWGRALDVGLWASAVLPVEAATSPSLALRNLSPQLLLYPAATHQPHHITPPNQPNQQPLPTSHYQHQLTATHSLPIPQVRHVLFTEPEIVTAGKEVTVYYNPRDTILAGRQRIWLQGGWNRCDAGVWGRV